MARRKEQRRQSKEQLANSVRKHFNSMGIIENEVVVDFLYKVRWQGMLIEGMWSVVCRVLIVHQIRISECDLLLSDLDDECIGFVSSIYRLRRFGAGLALYWFRRMVDTQFPTMIRRSGFGSSSKHFIGLSRYLRGNVGFSLWFERDVGDLGPRKGDTRIRPHQSDGSMALLIKTYTKSKILRQENTVILDFQRPAIQLFKFLRPNYMFVSSTGT
jgi:hypothetical protein